MRISIAVFLLSVTHFYTHGQVYYSVAAKSGLILREQSSKSSKAVDTLRTGEEVELVEKTNQSFNVIDGGKTIYGWWFKVKTKLNRVGYVFSGYLMQLQYNFSNPSCSFSDYSTSNNNYKTLPICNVVLSQEDFELTIYNYQIEDRAEAYDYLPKRKSMDTITMIEGVFNEIGDKLIRLTPSKGVKSVKLFYTSSEGIFEQYDYRKIPRHEEEKWFENRVKWTGYEPFAEVKGERDFYRMPLIYDREVFRKKKMNLRDTLIDLSGESSNVATLIYKNKPCVYSIDKVYLKIEVTDFDNVKRSKYIEIILSYGC